MQRKLSSNKIDSNPNERRTEGDLIRFRVCLCRNAGLVSVLHALLQRYADHLSRFISFYGLSVLGGEIQIR